VSGSVDFARQLEKQIQFLEVSCREYDAGNHDEAIRIATAIRVIFHHTKASVSILAHLAASGTNVLSTAGKRASSHSDGFWPALIQMGWNLETNVAWCNPTYGIRSSAHRTIPATAWWDGEVVFVGSGKRLKRKQLVLYAADKDGGAHVDGSFPAEYQWLINGADVSTSIRLPDGSELQNILPNPHLAYLRQMGYEVLRSPELLKLAGR
jgi:hypothetical protein